MTTTRRSFLGAVAMAATSSLREEEPLQELNYSDVQLAPGLAQIQFEQTQAVLLGLNEDSLLKPWRLRAGLPAPGPEMGGWYDELPLDKTESGGHGFAPAHCFRQWISALARGYAITQDAPRRAKLQKLLALYEPTISPRFYKNFRFPAYNYDKMVIGLIDAERFANLSHARRLLEMTTDAAEQHLPPRALDRDEPQRGWRASVGDKTTDDYTWDEGYTLPENLYLAYQRGAGERYLKMARRFLLDETYFDPLSENKDVLNKHHAYSFCNALSSAMQAYLVDRSRKHLRAASNALAMITAKQSYATGGWGPNESFIAADSDSLYQSLTGTHRGFETPCGSYAHFKLTRYLLRVTREGRYGDSMERVLYNTVLGAKPLQKDGRAFYYSDYNFSGKKTYFPDAWPCCSGTLPQVSADYRILAYLKDAKGIFVNLYLPSQVKWAGPDGALVKLSQEGDYPLSGSVTLRVDVSRPSRFALRLRIPAWSAKAKIRLNDAPVYPRRNAGFATLDRRWKAGDQIEIRFDMTRRLEPIHARHPDTVALLEGPLVLFAIGDGLASMERQKLLAAKVFKPFFAIEDERYSTYVTVA
jgi:uncharacterized protein